jgi:hypothetical protein
VNKSSICKDPAACSLTMPRKCCRTLQAGLHRRRPHRGKEFLEADAEQAIFALALTVRLDTIARKEA